MTALVYLLREPRTLTEEALRAIVSRELEIDCTGDDAGENFLVEVAIPPSEEVPAGSCHCYVLHLEDAVFSVNNFRVPYMDDPEEIAEEIQDPCMQAVLKEHTAWISVDCLDEIEDDTHWVMAYATIGRVMAGLAGPDCLGLYCPEMDACVEYDDSILESLRSEAPLMLFDEGEYGPVIYYDGDDARINAAVDEARSRWPEFVAAFGARSGEQPPYAVKAKFEHGETVEFMWVVVQRIDGDTIFGILDSEPRELTHVEPGDAVEISAGAIYDWIYPAGEGFEGAFTMKAVEEAEE